MWSGKKQAVFLQNTEFPAQTLLLKENRAKPCHRETFGGEACFNVRTTMSRLSDRLKSAKKIRANLSARLLSMRDTAAKTTELTANLAAPKKLRRLMWLRALLASCANPI